ncbi:MAG TPA: PhzF family phenazine biosynthesis protein [Gemmatimonadota bacterium]|nr:PhzF family phenazine biosynthesis protein [Gemmatimonadota bacterium]
MHRIPIYQVDAFTGAVFGGNPAAVCPLDEWLPDETLQAIAAENNLSETAFLVPGRDPVPLRWFTPRLEVKLCGHATLASAFVLFEFLEPGRERVSFETMSGRLSVRREGDRLSMDFPAIGSARVAPDDVPAVLIEGLGAEPDEVRFTDDDWNYIAVFADADTVTGLRPDFRLIERVHPHGVAATGPGGAGANGVPDIDFVSRYFVPGYGIPEDPVTGSIHCALAPYWAGRLDREQLSAHQVSERGGRLDLVVAGERVHIEGTAVTYMTGEIVVP